MRVNRQPHRKGGFVGVEASADAQNGSYNIEVLALAKSHKVMSNNSFDSDPKAELGSGTLDITIDGKTLSLDINKEKSSLKDIVNAINNAEDNPGVTATVINDDNGAKIVFLVLKQVKIIRYRSMHLR